MEPGAASGFMWVIDLQGMHWRDIATVYRLTSPSWPVVPTDEQRLLAEAPGRGKRSAGKECESLVSTLANHYPETFGGMVLLRPPFFIYSCWNALKATIDPKTASLWHFVRSENEINDTLQSLFPPEAAQWIRDEIALIKHKPEPGPCGHPDYWGDVLQDEGPSRPAAGAAAEHNNASCGQPWQLACTLPAHLLVRQQDYCSAAPLAGWLAAFQPARLYACLPDLVLCCTSPQQQTAWRRLPRLASCLRPMALRGGGRAAPARPHPRPASPDDRVVHGVQAPPNLSAASRNATTTRPRPGRAARPRPPRLPPRHRPRPLPRRNPQGPTPGRAGPAPAPHRWRTVTTPATPRHRRAVGGSPSRHPPQG